MSRYFDDIFIAADAIHLEAKASGIDMGRTTARRMATVAMEVFRREDLEEPQWWWWWNGEEWEEDEVPNLHVYVSMNLAGRQVCRVYGTTADRDAKRDALLEAARKAGKPS